MQGTKQLLEPIRRQPKLSAHEKKEFGKILMQNQQLTHFATVEKIIVKVSPIIAKKAIKSLNFCNQVTTKKSFVK